jgi:hypothetical protein
MVFISVLVFMASQVKLSENASNILPQSSKDSELGEILENISFSDRVFFNISLHDTSITNPNLLINSAEDIKRLLEKSCSKEIKSIQLQVQEQSIQQVSDYVLRNLPFLLSPADYQDFDQLIDSSNLQKNFKKKYRSLLSPASVFLKTIILKDPVGLSNKPLQKLRSFQLDDSIELEKNCIFTRDKKHLIFISFPIRKLPRPRKTPI